MLIAGSVDSTQALSRLADERPLFHSEADFQHALAWLIHSLDPQIRVRLETKPEPGVRLDLSFERPDLGLTTAVELKYMTRKLSVEVGDEAYALTDQSAPDLHCYDVLKDITRLERFVGRRERWNGLLIALTNVAGYWTDRAAVRLTNAAEFRLYEGTEVSGVRRWGPNTGAGTMRKREAELAFVGSYTLRWRDYSDLGIPHSKFRALVVEVS